MSKLLGFVFDNVWGKAVLIAAGLVALVSAFAWDQQERGARDAVSKINTHAQEQVQEARKARDAVPDSGNVDWLRKRACRDC